MTAKSRSPHVAVVMLTRNQRDFTIRCLSSFQAVQTPRYTILLWDNGSEDDTVDAVRTTFPHVLVYRHSTNLGVAAGRNAAAAMAINVLKPSHLLFLDNDTVVTPDFLDNLIGPLGNDSMLGQVVPKVKLLEEPTRLDEAGTGLRIWLAQSYGLGHGEIDGGQYDVPNDCIAGGCCNLVRTDVFQSLGGFDTQFDPYGPEDIDFSLRLQKLGYRCMYIPEAVIFHRRSKTPFDGKYTPDYAQAKAKNWLAFIRKHGSLGQQLAFWTVGLPAITLKAAIREAKKGNLQALRGAAYGALALCRSSRGGAQKKE